MKKKTKPDIKDRPLRVYIESLKVTVIMALTMTLTFVVVGYFSSSFNNNPIYMVTAFIFIQIFWGCIKSWGIILENITQIYRRLLIFFLNPIIYYYALLVKTLFWIMVLNKYPGWDLW